MEQSDDADGQSPECRPTISYWKCPKGPWRNSREYRGIGLLNLALVDQQFLLSQRRSAREKEGQERGAQPRCPSRGLQRGPGPCGLVKVNPEKPV